MRGIALATALAGIAQRRPLLWRYLRRAGPVSAPEPGWLRLLRQIGAAAWP